MIETRLIDGGDPRNCHNFAGYRAAKGLVTIWATEDLSAAEVDYDSKQAAGSGCLRDVIQAVCDVRAACEEYAREYGISSFFACPDNRDGHAEIRERVMARYLPALQIRERVELI